MSIFRIKIEHVPSYKEYTVDINELRRWLYRAEIDYDKLWDGFYYGVCFEDWLKIFRDTLSNMPKYTIDKFDCDNFALLTVARITEKYHINGCGIAIGDSPMGYHAWNIFLTETALYYMEPQTGKVLSLQGEGYKADYVVWG